jgi:hypothetical protein
MDKPILTPLIQTLHYLLIRFRICEDIRKITCIRTARDSAYAVSALSWHRRCERQHKVNISRDGAMLDLQRQREVGFRTIYNSADADIVCLRHH